MLSWSIKWVVARVCPYCWIIFSPSKDNLFRCCCVGGRHKVPHSYFSYQEICTCFFMLLCQWCGYVAVHLSITLRFTVQECSCNCTGVRENYTGNLYRETPWGLFYKHGWTLISMCKSNSTSYEMWNKITYPYSNFNGYTIEDLELVSIFIPQFNQQVNTYPYWD